MKKPITEYTNEELLKTITNEPTVNLEPVNDVLDFISVYNIQSGTHKVASNLLYKTYQMWSQNPLPAKAFTYEMQDFFPLIESYYSLNKDPLELKKLLIEYRTPKSKTKMPQWQKHFNEFVEHYSLKRGRLLVKNKVLYNLYDKWVYENKKQSLNSYQFNRFCKSHFKSKKIRDDRWYLIKPTIIDHLSPELRNQIRFQNRNRGIKSKKST